MNRNPASPKRTRWKKSVMLLCTASLGLWLGCAWGEPPEGYLNLLFLPEGCEKAATCGELVGVNCGAEVDGPYYYVRRDTGRILQVCGGACMAPERKPGVCEACPPPEWTCGN